MGKLDGKIALVTGGAMGNGRGIAEVLAKHGATVMLADLSDTVFATEAELRAQGLPVKAFQVNIVNRPEVDACVREIVNEFHKIDILVNNAGVARMSRFTEMTDELRDFHIDVNIKGTWNVSQAVLPLMIANQYGKVVNISSVTGPLVIDPGYSAYALTKAAIIGLTKALAIETVEDNITVNAICPGYILTPNVKRSAGRTNPENPQAVLDGIAQGIPMKKLGTIEQIGDLAAFLASDESAYITGTYIVIDGGNSLPETNVMGLYHKNT